MYKVNIPTFLTWLRILVIPLLVVCFYLDYRLAAAFIMGFAGFTDWADGFLARRWGVESRLGAFLDPVADKLIVVSALLLIVEREQMVLITLAAMVIVGREIVISALREWMAEVGARGKVAVAYIGKVKTVAQIFALVFLLYNQPLWGIPIREIGLFLLMLATILTLISMVQYLFAAFRQ